MTFVDTFLIDTATPVKADLYEDNGIFTVEYYVGHNCVLRETLNEKANLLFIENYIENKLKSMVILNES